MIKLVFKAKVIRRPLLSFGTLRIPISQGCDIPASTKSSSGAFYYDNICDLRFLPFLISLAIVLSDIGEPGALGVEVLSSAPSIHLVN